MRVAWGLLPRQEGDLNRSERVFCRRTPQTQEAVCRSAGPAVVALFVRVVARCNLHSKMCWRLVSGAAYNLRVSCRAHIVAEPGSS